MSVLAPPSKPPVARPVQPARPSRTNQGVAAIHLALIALTLLAMLPFFWLVCTAFKQGPDLHVHLFLPWRHLNRLTLDNFSQLLKSVPFLRWLANSLFLASTHTVLVVTLSSLGGFALAKYRFPGKRPLMLLMLGTMLLPAQVLLPGSYELMYHLGWIDSYAAILIPGAVSVFGMFLFKQAMQAVPDELLQAGRVDGCSEFRLWWEIALPIIRPTISAFTLLSFLSSWNSFLWPQIILQNEARYTLPIGLANMTARPEYQSDFGILMAGTLLSILPVIGLFFLLQKDFLPGLSRGAVKG